MEQYLERVCAVRVIAENELIQEFLTDDEEVTLTHQWIRINTFIQMSPLQSAKEKIDLKILLPDREVICVNVPKNSNTDQVYKALVNKIRLSQEASHYFALFEIVEYNFGKLKLKRLC